MTFKDLAEQASQSAIGWGVPALLMGIIWLIRRVFTNQKQIELMRNDQVNRDAERKRDREEYSAAFIEIKAGQKELGQDIKKLSQK